MSHDESAIRGQAGSSERRKAVGDEERLRFIEELNASYVALRNDPEAWREELEERAIWDRALLDGLEDD